MMGITVKSPDEQNEAPEESLFNSQYYRTGCGPSPYERNDHWLNFFGAAADQIIRSLKPKRVWDAGCAMGMLVESFWDRGVEAWGVDISEYAISKVRPDMREFCKVGSILDPSLPAAASGPFDLVTCIEVVEHLPQEQVRPAVEQLTRIAGQVFFSSSSTDFVEPTHFSVRPPIFWLKLFAEFGFCPDLVFDGSFVAPHVILFRRTAEPIAGDVLASFAERLRIKVALVERETRIGKLSAELATGINAQRNLEEQLLRENKELQKLLHLGTGTIEELKKNALALTVDLEAARKTSDRILENQDRALSESIRVTARLISIAETERMHGAAAVRRLETAKRDLARETERNQRLQDEKNQLESQLHRRTSLMAAGAQEQDSFRNQLAAQQNDLQRALADTHSLQQRLADQQAELHSIKSSPGWAAILRYREWLKSLEQSPKPVRWIHQVVSRRVVARASAGAPSPTQEDTPASIESSVEIPKEAFVVEATPPQGEEKQAEPVAAARFGSDYTEWVAQTTPTPGRENLNNELAFNLAYRPLISILVPVFKVPRQVVLEMVESVLRQNYDHWELCIVHADPGDREVNTLLTGFASRDPRIKVRTLPENLGISGNSNAALELVEGEFIALLDHDDLLAPEALFENVRALSEDPSISFLYSDKDQLDEISSARLDPLFKPRWSPEIMWSANYLTHLCVIRTSLVKQVGAWRKETDGAQDWDLFLRVIRAGATVHHIPKVLYHWRRIATSVALGGLAAKPYVTEAQRVCLADHARETGWHAELVPLSSGYWKWIWDPTRFLGVSIVCDLGHNDLSLISEHARRLRAATEYPDFEIVYPVQETSNSASEPASEEGVRLVQVPAAYTLKDRLQTAADSCVSPCLVFLDHAVAPGDAGWLAEMTGPLGRSDVGIVGAKLVDSETGNLRHAGICFNLDGNLAYIFSNQPEHVYNQFGGANWYRDWSAVSGACFAVRRDDWLALGGLNSPLDYPRFDIDLCLRIQFERGLRIFYNPFARLLQHRPAALEEWQSSPHWGSVYFQSCFPEGDPYFNPNLICQEGKLAFLDPELEKKPAKLYDQSSENRALVGAFDFNQHQLAASRETTGAPATGVLNRITWVIPDFTVAFYGGIHTILRFADYFLRLHHVHSDFVFLGHAHTSIVRTRITAAFPALGADATIIKLRNFAQLESLPESDCAISTLWTTAYAALLFNKTRRKFYFLQDYEPLFYAAGSISALVEATYGFGYTAICNTVELQRRYLEHGSPAEYFKPSIDGSVFFPAPSPKTPRRPYRLFCYARPSHSRNCFELLSAALRKLHDRFGTDLQIVTAGASWDPHDENLDGVVENLGMLGYRETGALYRSCDAGAVMMMTAHPSYLPLELMACGALVITNRNTSTRWLLQDEENCLLAAPSASSFADRIEEGLRNEELRRRVTQNALTMVREDYSDWDGQAEKVFRYIKSVC